MNKIWYVWCEIEESRGWLVVSELWRTTNIILRADILWGWYSKILWCI